MKADVQSKKKPALKNGLLLNEKTVHCFIPILLEVVGDTTKEQAFTTN
jgi:hypothetical protein